MRITEDEIQLPQTKLSAAFRNGLDIILQELEERYENEGVHTADLRESFILDAAKIQH